MQPYQIRRAAVVLLGIILIVFVVVQGVRFLGNIGADKAEDQGVAVERTLPEYAEIDSRVRLTYSGPIVAREDYQQIRMTIAGNRRVIEIIDGYGNDVAKARRFNNTTEAYYAFLRALHINSFTNEQENELGDDAAGVCFRGKRIVGQVFDGGSQIQSLWAASCDDDAGTMNARWRDILKLFEDQFPNYDDFTDDIRF